MPTDRFSHTFRVAAPAVVIYAHLMNPYSYVGLSPPVVAVRDVRAVRDAQGHDAIGYVAVERFRVGPLQWDDLIHVTMTGKPERQVVSAEARPGGVRLTSTVDLAGDDDGTTVTETIELDSPALLRRFALGRATSAQRRRAAELTRRMQC
jgi:hypothetical protein